MQSLCMPEHEKHGTDSNGSHEAELSWLTQDTEPVTKLADAITPFDATGFDWRCVGGGPSRLRGGGSLKQEDHPRLLLIGGSHGLHECRQMEPWDSGDMAPNEVWLRTQERPI